ncbi:DNA topology modulation protein FlaR [Paenibacillus prosopidis]|uniref:Adenylate kinase family enzyme n=1 Tax=Paenibacillus prosopidis TaxID=630520 RepID=A0A368VHA0_9BACL|nr:DNA topology modulation protein FlaR [Paenibacillus prosopidis]RCW40571.1 hypothetical protein DFP97_1325 [Paenibacillus prosopidis]
MEQTYKRIHIIGEVGSGKTYLAKQLSEMLSIPYYQLDNVVWKRTEVQDIRNSPEVRDEILERILKTESWIIEGVHYKWVLKSFEFSDVIIFLHPNVYKRDRQMILRYLKQKIGIEKGNYKQDIRNLIQMLKWNHNFESQRLPKINEALQPYKFKVIYFTENNDVINRLNPIEDQLVLG